VATERFECVLSRTSAITTWTLVGILAVVALAFVGIFLWVGSRTGWPSPVTWLAVIVPSCLVLVLGSIVAGTWAYSPRAIVVGPEAIVVERFASPITIPLASIRAVRPVTPAELRGTIRTLGSSGMFGSMGRFHAPALGSFRMYLTDLADAVVIDGDERFVVSPAGRDRFVALLHARLAAGRGKGGSGGA